MNEKKFNQELFRIIYPYIKGKKILDVGCVDHSINRAENPLWIHNFLRKSSSDVTGIDILKKEIEILRKKGYNVYHKNAENFRFNNKFEVIFAGELIEHLSNPGLFIRQCRKNLEKNGLLIITTPNSFNLYMGIKNFILLRDNPHENSEHVVLFSPTLIRQLLDREGFTVSKISFFNIHSTRLGKIRNNLLSMLGNKFKRRMVIFAKKK